MQKERFAVALRVIGNSLSKSSFSLDKKKESGRFWAHFHYFFLPLFLQSFAFAAALFG